jgi:hypothetical protein
MKIILLIIFSLSLASCGQDITRTVSEAVPVGDETCPNGGTKTTEYVDSNDNGQLDSDEIRGSDVYHCNPEEDDEVTTL